MIFQYGLQLSYWRQIGVFKMHSLWSLFLINFTIIEDEDMMHAVEIKILSNFQNWVWEVVDRKFIKRVDHQHLLQNTNNTYSMNVQDKEESTTQTTFASFKTNMWWRLLEIWEGQRFYSKHYYKNWWSQ